MYNNPSRLRVVIIMYTVFKEELNSDETGDYVTFGIRWQNDRSFSVSDISLDEEQVTNLAHLFNELELDPTHLFDAVEDFVYDN